LLPGVRGVQINEEINCIHCYLITAHEWCA